MTLELASFPAASPLQEKEQFTRPGTANVSPADVKKLGPLMRHYGSKPHPFTSCKRDQMRHGLSEDHANRRCAVLKDLIRGTTKWRSREDAAADLGWSTEQLGTFISECEAELQAIVTSVGPEALTEAIEGGAAFMLLESDQAEDGPDELIEMDLSAEGRKKMAASKTAMPDGSFPIPNVEALRKAIRAFGRAKDKTAARVWIKKRARALGATNLLPADWKLAEAESELFYLAEEAAAAVAIFGSLPEKLGEAYDPPSWVVPKQAKRPGFRPLDNSARKKKREERRSGSSKYDESKHPRGPMGKWISKGQSGPAVTGIQKRLGIKRTGSFDGNTRKKVIAYQKAHGLKVDGIVGSQTAASMLGKSPRAPGVLPDNLRSQLQKLVKKKMKEGEVDGPLTERTVHTEARQRDNGVKSASHSSIRSAIFDLSDRMSPTHTVELPNGTTVKVAPTVQPSYGGYGRTFTVANGKESLTASSVEEAADTAKELDSRQGAGASGTPVGSAS